MILYSKFVGTEVPSISTLWVLTLRSYVYFKPEIFIKWHMREIPALTKSLLPP